MKRYIETLIELKDYTDQFDAIYPSHSELPLKPDCISKLIEAAKQVYAGQAEGTEVEVHGKTVNLYSFEVAGFLYEE